jgi:hypothetical protein
MTKLLEDLFHVGSVHTGIRFSARTRAADSDLELKRESRLRTFKVVLLIDGVETEVMFIEATSPIEAAHTVCEALIDGKSYEREKWALQITQHGWPGETCVIPP